MISVRPVAGLPEIESGAPLGAMLADAAGAGEGDVLVISQKVVSKAEGRGRNLEAVQVGERAAVLADELGKDPRLVQLVLDESNSVLRAEGGVLIVETRSGLICANAGIDSSNVPGDDQVMLLPVDADESARRLRAEISRSSGASPAVVIADSFGRAWRLGQTDIAIGCAGLDPLADWRGRTDREGRELSATHIAIADEVASAADLARDKTSGTPAVVIEGLDRYVSADDGPGAAALRRPESEDLFR